MKTIFQQYYEVRQQIDNLNVLESKLKEDVLAELEKSTDSTVKTDFGNFTKRISKRYSFSTNIAELGVSIEKQIKEFSEPYIKKIDEYAKPLKDQLEIAKKNEIETGKAVEQTNVTMAFSYLKKEE